MATAEEYGLGPATFPRGWFIVAEANEMDDGPVAVRFFGQDFSLYRGESGKVVMLDAYCPHMGTHLAASKSPMIVQNGEQIEGDSIRCPYHGWRFNAEGQCDDIPYFDGPKPRSANIASYPVKEVMGCIMVWWDPEGGEPEYEAPFLKEWDDPSWVQWSLDHLGELNLHPQEILDNMADVHHLGPTHGAPCEYFENEFKDHVYIQRQGGWHQAYDCMLITTTWYTGPGVLLSKQLFGETLAIELIANTPVDDGVSKVWHAVLHKSPNDVANDEDRAVAKEVQAGALQAFAADFDVWTHKRSATRVLQVQTDGPFAKGRTWYKQYYDVKTNRSNFTDKVNGIHHIPNFETPSEEASAFGAEKFD
jgi:3-ketosteroid 9alpha-monooxygenase subunit A